MYVPKKVQALATTLMADQDFEACLLTLRQMYPNLCSFRSALSRLKACIIATNNHHPDYEAAMQEWQDEVEKDKDNLENPQRVLDIQISGHAL